MILTSAGAGSGYLASSSDCLSSIMRVPHFLFYQAFPPKVNFYLAATPIIKIFPNFAIHYILYRMQRFLSFLAFTVTFGATAVCAQELTWGVDFNTYFDNREGSDAVTPTKTYFLTALAPEIGLKFTKHDRIAGGAVWTQPIGNQWDGYRISPTLYYRHESRHWNFSFGMFPRTQLREQLPGFLWSDSLTYFQHNIRGALVEYKNSNGYVEAYLDWRQMQTEKKREAFNIVVHGDWLPQGSVFFAGGHAMMNHYALTRHSSPDEHIVDNFLINPYVGVDLGSKTPLDSLRIRAGALITMERNRAYSSWRTPAGGWLEAVGEWKWLGLKNTLYIGGKLLPSYADFGSTLYPGEPFYAKGFYNRTDVYARILRNKWMDLQASLNFNVSSGGDFIFYQKLTLNVHLDQSLFKKKKD